MQSSANSLKNNNGLFGNSIEENTATESIDYGSSCGEGSMDDNELRKNSPTSQLAQWAVKHNITNVTTSDLLEILYSCHANLLPIDARTLLKTNISNNTSVTLKIISPGYYYHFGISNGIKNHYHK